MITCQCGHCGATFQVDAAYEGSRVTCKNCGYRVDVPALAESTGPSSPGSTPPELPSYPEEADWSEVVPSAGEADSTEETSASEETFQAEPVFAPESADSFESTYSADYADSAQPPHSMGPTFQANVEPDPREGLAKASLILGLFSLFCCCGLTGIPAVICGHLALGHFGAGPVTRRKGYAIAGLVLGYVSIAFMALNLIVAVLGNSGPLKEPAPPPLVRPRRPVEIPLPAERPLKVDETGVVHDVDQR